MVTPCFVLATSVLKADNTLRLCSLLIGLLFMTVDPDKMSGSKPHVVKNLLRGEWQLSSASICLPDPLNGEPFLRVPDTSTAETAAFITSLKECPKSGLHNPYKSPERYMQYGAACAKAAAAMRDPHVERFFARLIQRVAPKSYAQESTTLIA
jgi:1-pyrroline-5-carboxylate dehydrogenase